MRDLIPVLQRHQAALPGGDIRAFCVENDKLFTYIGGPDPMQGGIRASNPLAAQQSVGVSVSVAGMRAEPVAKLMKSLQMVASFAPQPQ